MEQLITAGSELLSARRQEQHATRVNLLSALSFNSPLQMASFPPQSSSKFIFLRRVRMSLSDRVIWGRKPRYNRPRQAQPPRLLPDDFPHIFEAIIACLPLNQRLRLRLVCSTLKTLVDRSYPTTSLSIIINGRGPPDVQANNVRLPFFHETGAPVMQEVAMRRARHVHIHGHTADWMPLDARLNVWLGHLQDNVVVTIEAIRNTAQRPLVLPRIRRLDVGREYLQGGEEGRRLYIARHGARELKLYLYIHEYPTHLLDEANYASRGRAIDLLNQDVQTLVIAVTWRGFNHPAGHITNVIRLLFYGVLAAHVSKGLRIRIETSDIAFHAFYGELDLQEDIARHFRIPPSHVNVVLPLRLGY